MQYALSKGICDLGYFDLETRVLVIDRKSVRPQSVTDVTGTLCKTHVSGPDPFYVVAAVGLEQRPRDYENTGGSCSVLKGVYSIQFFNCLQTRPFCLLCIQFDRF